MCGADIDVPLRRFVVKPPLAGDTAARTSCPGAVMSGFSWSIEARLGPRDENAAMSGAGTLVLTTPCAIVAVAPAVAP